MEQKALFGGPSTHYDEKKKPAAPPSVRAPFPTLSLASGAESRSYIAGDSVFWLRILQNQATRQKPHNVAMHRTCLMSELKMKQGLWPAHIAARHALLMTFAQRRS